MLRLPRLASAYIASLFKSNSKSETSEAFGAVANEASTAIELNVSPWLIEKYLGFVNVRQVENTRLAEIEFTTPDAGLSQALANAHVQTFMRMSLETRFGLTQEARDFLEQKKQELRKKLDHL